MAQPAQLPHSAFAEKVSYCVLRAPPDRHV